MREDISAVDQWEARGSAKGEWIDTVNPYTGEPWARIPRGTAEDSARAVKAAKRALDDSPWSRMTATERGKVMRRIGDLIVQHATPLAATETRDNGKVFTEMQGDKPFPNTGTTTVGLLTRSTVRMPVEKADVFAFTTHEPVGVGAALAHEIAAAIFVVKVRSRVGRRLHGRRQAFGICIGEFAGICCAHQSRTPRWRL